MKMDQLKEKFFRFVDNISLPRERRGKAQPDTDEAGFPLKASDETDLGIIPKNDTITGRKHYIPFFLVTISIVELALFLTHSIHLVKEHDQHLTSSGPAPICSAFAYNPKRRYEVWRYITYCITHSGWVHMVNNVITQMLLGIFLEITHGPWRVGLVYMSGVLAGSLMTSVLDPGVYLVGASGGVYALLAAHIPTIILNFREIQSWTEWFVNTAVILIGLIDIVFSIVMRYVAKDAQRGEIGYVAHLGGGLAGFLVGAVVLKNYEKEAWENVLRWVCIGTWTIGVSIAIIVNSVGGDAMYPKTDWGWIYDCDYDHIIRR